MKSARPTLLVSAIVWVLLFSFWRIVKNPRFQFFGDIYYRVQTTEKIVALTFDDGPNPNNTDLILDVLSKNRVSATFFMIGLNIEKYPEIAKRVFSRGHQLANHSYSHQRMIFQSREFCEDEIGKTDRLIRGTGYNGEIVFRPPYGKKFLSLPFTLARLHKKSVTWDSESDDTASQEPSILVEKALSHVGPGSILLFHDGGKLKPGTIDAIEKIIVNLQAQGYQFLRVNELLARSKP